MGVRDLDLREGVLCCESDIGVLTCGCGGDLERCALFACRVAVLPVLDLRIRDDVVREIYDANRSTARFGGDVDMDREVEDAEVGLETGTKPSSGYLRWGMNVCDGRGVGGIWVEDLNPSV